MAGAEQDDLVLRQSGIHQPGCGGGSRSQYRAHERRSPAKPPAQTAWQDSLLQRVAGDCGAEHSATEQAGRAANKQAGADQPPAKPAG